MDTVCLIEAELHRYHAREMDEREAAAVAAHLKLCEACAERDAALRRQHDDLLGRLRHLPVDVNGTLTVRAATAQARPSPVIAIPGYEILNEVHRGGQGIVYKAIQKATKRVVAIKVMRESAFADARDRSRFEREVEVLAQLRHPNIVAIHDSGRAGEHSYYVMDYISGLPLDEYVQKSIRGGVKPASQDAGAGRSAAARRDRRTASDGRALSRSQARREINGILNLFAKVCDAVNAAHLRGVIHRDLKPGNIRVDADGNPYVLDFGLAKLITGNLTTGDSPQVMTETGQFVGSLPWASPEQAEAVPSKIDVRTDVYSLGVILYQLLTGQLPHEIRPNLRETLDRIVHADPVRPRSVEPAIDAELEIIVLKCLAKKRERRYQIADGLADDLRRYAAGKPIAARRDSLAYVLGKHLFRYRARVAFGAVLLVAIATAAYTTWDARYQSFLHTRDRTRFEAHEAFVSRDFTSCVEIGKRFLTDKSPDLDIQILVVSALLQLGQHAEATAALGEMEKRYPDEADVYYLLSESTALTDPDKSRAYLKTAERLNGDSARSYYLRSLFQEEHVAAIDLLTRGLTIAPKSFECVMARCARYYAVGTLATDGDSGQAAFGRMYRDAERALELRSHDASTWHNLGTAALRLQRTDEALAKFERATELDPHFVPALLGLGIAYGRKGDWTKAAEAFDRAVAQRPEDAELLRRLANARWRLREFAAAADAWDHVKRLRPRDLEAAKGFAATQQELGNSAGLERAYKEWLSIDGADRSFVFHALAEFYLRREQFQDALTTYEQLHGEQADDADACNALADILLKHAGSNEAANRALALSGHALDIRPDHWPYLATRALAEFRIGASRDAYKHAARAVELTRGRPHPEVLAVAAHAAAATGRTREAHDYRNLAQVLIDAQDYRDPWLEHFLTEFDAALAPHAKESPDEQ